ncbi:hypothetical protein MB46_19865 (plasmid) [Arthrobacter alpinus]|nr:hypothetical protein MB46_19865 [Arthrobacter alpinus]
MRRHRGKPAGDVVITAEQYADVVAELAKYKRLVAALGRVRRSRDNAVATARSSAAAMASLRQDAEAQVRAAAAELRAVALQSDAPRNVPPRTAPEHPAVDAALFAELTKQLGNARTAYLGLQKTNAALKRRAPAPLAEDKELRKILNHWKYLARDFARRKRGLPLVDHEAEIINTWTNWTTKSNNASTTSKGPNR